MKIGIILQLGIITGKNICLTHTAKIPKECLKRLKPIVSEYLEEIVKTKKEKKICPKCGTDNGYIFNKL